MLLNLSQSGTNGRRKQFTPNYPWTPSEIFPHRICTWNCADISSAEVKPVWRRHHNTIKYKLLLCCYSFLSCLCSAAASLSHHIARTTNICATSLVLVVGVIATFSRHNRKTFYDDGRQQHHTCLSLRKIIICKIDTHLARLFEVIPLRAVDARARIVVEFQFNENIIK